jgi:hypothetical protein
MPLQIKHKKYASLLHTTVTTALMLVVDISNIRGIKESNKKMD